MFAVLVALLTVVSGCTFSDYKDGSPGGSSGPVAGGPAPAPAPGSAATFSEVNSEIFQPLCSSCHDSGRSPDLSSYSSFATDTEWIVPGDPSSSLIYEEVASGAMPQGGPALDDSQLALLASWIESGAPNN